MPPSQLELLRSEVHLTQSKIQVADGTVSHEALSASNADSTLRIVKEQQPTFKVETGKPQRPFLTLWFATL